MTEQNLMEAAASELANKAIDRFEHPENAADALDLAVATVRDRHGLKGDTPTEVFIVFVQPPQTSSYLTCVTEDEQKAISQRAAAENQHGLGTAEIQVHEVHGR